MVFLAGIALGQVGQTVKTATTGLGPHTLHVAVVTTKPAGTTLAAVGDGPEVVMVYVDGATPVEQKASRTVVYAVVTAFAVAGWQSGQSV